MRHLSRADFRVTAMGAPAFGAEGLADAWIVDASRSPNGQRPQQPTWSMTPIVKVIAFGILLLVGIGIGTTISVFNLQERAFANSERELRNIALIIGEQ